MTSWPLWKRNGRYLNRNAKTLSRAGDMGWSVAHRVDDGVDRHLVGEGRVLQRVLGHLRPFPGIPEVRVVVDGDDEPALVVEDAAVERRIAVLLPGMST